MNRRGYGAQRVGQWWAVIPIEQVSVEPWSGPAIIPPLRGHYAWTSLETMCVWVRSFGYGDGRL
jgi:hypothetical protein